MPFKTRLQSEIAADLIRDIAGKAPAARTSADSDWRIRANATASAIEGLYQHQAWIVKQIFPQSADDDFLLQHAASRGLTLKPAKAAIGTVVATGAPTTVLQSDLLLKHADGRAYRTTAVAQVAANGTVNIPVIAYVTGLASELAAGESLTWQSAPLGIDSKAVSGGIDGAAEIESFSSLLDRLLDIIRRPPAGGNKYDYRRWALEVPGVTAAYVYPIRRGPGTVDVVIVAQDGLPDIALLAAVRAHLEDVRPVTAWNCAVIAPTIKSVPLSIAVTPLAGFTLPQLRPAIEAVATAYFAGLQPGDSFIRAQLLASLVGVHGVADVAIASPASNVAPAANAQIVEWLRMGLLSLVLL